MARSLLVLIALASISVSVSYAEEPLVQAPVFVVPRVCQTSSLGELSTSGHEAANCKCSSG